MMHLEDVSKLQHEIKKKYPSYVHQFYSAAADIVNQNYVPPKFSFDDLDGELPFYEGYT